MEDEWINPFDSCHSDLISISTVSCAPTDNAEDFQLTKLLREKAYLQFSSERLENQTKQEIGHALDTRLAPQTVTMGTS